MFPSPQSVKEPGNWDGNAQYGETLDRDISVAKGMPEDENILPGVLAVLVGTLPRC